MQTVPFPLSCTSAAGTHPDETRRIIAERRERLQRLRQDQIDRRATVTARFKKRRNKQA